MSTIPRQILPSGTPDNADSAAQADVGQRYRFEHLTLPTVLRDMYFCSNDPGPCDRVPEFDLPTVSGGRFRLRVLRSAGNPDVHITRRPRIAVIPDRIAANQ